MQQRLQSTRRALLGVPERSMVHLHVPHLHKYEFTFHSCSNFETESLLNCFYFRFSSNSTEAGCPIIATPDNGKITYLNSKASAMLFCEPNFETVGSSFAHCNGSHWDRGIGTCRETDNAPPMSCDFESEKDRKCF